MICLASGCGGICDGVCSAQICGGLSLVSDGFSECRLTKVGRGAVGGFSFVSCDNSEDRLMGAGGGVFFVFGNTGGGCFVDGGVIFRSMSSSAEVFFFSG